MEACAMKKYTKPQAYVAETKDQRFAGTFEVLVPVPDRVKPHRIGGQFDSQQAAEGWLHSDEGQEAIAEVFAEKKSDKKPAKAR
jgi:hypothetical protein